MTEYPAVHTEFETLDAVRAGASLARFGDGELAIMEGHDRPREPATPELSAELREVIRSKRCLVGIPRPNEQADKHDRWIRKYQRFLPFLREGREYYSAFISRPDWGPWLRTQEYAERVRALWRGHQRVAVVAPDGSALATVVRRDCEVVDVECPPIGAYTDVDRLEREALDAAAELVLMSAGFTATCLAHRLAPHTQAVDIGSIGLFLRSTLPIEAPP